MSEFKKGFKTIMNVLAGNLLRALAEIGSTIVNIYSIVIIVRIILSWLQISPYSNQIAHFFYLITEPYLRFFRKLLPPIPAGTMYLDLSPIIALITLRAFERIVFQTIGMWGTQLVMG